MGRSEPEFSRQAGLILRSPYFYRQPPAGLSDKYLKLFLDAQDRELWTLREALKLADSFDALAGDGRLIYERAVRDMPAGWQDATHS